SLANNCGPFVFTVNATATTASLTIDNTSGQTWYLQFFSLSLYQNGALGVTTDAGNTTAVQTFTIFSGQGNNGQQICNQSGPTGAFCVQITGGPGAEAIAGGGSVTYAFNITNGVL